MSKHDSGASPEHRLFHAIVMMGGSLALGCGGEVTDATADPSDTPASGGKRDGNGGTGSVGTASGGAGSVGSGSGGTASGGRPGSGGAIAVGGAPPQLAGGAPSFVPPACPPPQWECAVDTFQCDYEVRGYEFPRDCSCNPERPRGSEDCGPGEILVCNLAVQDPNGERLDPGMAFGCLCMAAGLACDEACRQVGSFREELSCVEEQDVNGMVQYLCGCAVIVLR